MKSINSMYLSGNLTRTPELRYTTNGTAVSTFTVAHTVRVFNKTLSQWENGDTLFMECSAWREQAENVAASLSKGDPVVVTGFLKQRTFDAKDGHPRTVVSLDVEEIAVTLSRTKVTIERVERENFEAVTGSGPMQEALEAAF
jgi:single-strand DNA-binding protein